MDLTQLTTLKEKLIHARNFTRVWEYFMDQFGQDPEFIALGDTTEDPFLEAILLHVGKGLFGRAVTSADFLLTRLPEHQFLHGGGTIDGRLANVLYFEDIRIGLLAVVVSINPSETKMVRFSGRPMPADWSPSQN
jgi:hypothetical protein